MSRMKKLVFCLLLSAPCVLAQPKTLFYMTDHSDSVRDFLEHQSKIDIIVPTWYNVDPNGLVYGEPDPTVLRMVKQRISRCFLSLPSSTRPECTRCSLAIRLRRL